MTSETWLLIAATTLTVVAASLAYRMSRLIRIVRDHENHLLGLQYDVGLLAIALEDAGVPIHGDLRETAYLSRPDTAGQG